MVQTQIQLINFLLLLTFPQFSLMLCPNSTTDTSVNFMTNGDFQIPYLGPNNYRFTSDPLYGWTTAFKIQQGTGAIYNPRWGSNTQVIEIDTFQNQMYNQTLNLPACQALLTISYAARHGSALSTSGLRIWWNNQSIMHVQTSVDYQIHTQTFTLQTAQGSNYLTLEARGTSDGTGMSIDNVIFNKIVTTNKIVVNGQCQCEIGYFDDLINSQCQSCSSRDSYCLQCISTSNNFTCQKCQQNTFLNSTLACQQCSIIGCSNCSSLSSCFECNNSLNYYLNQTDQKCYICNIEGCILCSTLTRCSLCHQNYLINYKDQCTLICASSSCSVCGNNIVQPNQACDDGNKDLDDGCSAQCQVQAQFICQLNTNIRYRNSLCYYSGAAEMKVIYIEKSDNLNQIQVLISLYPQNIGLWDKVNFAEMITLPNIQGIEKYIVKRKSDGTVSIVISYSANIQNKEITVEIDPKKSGKLSLSKVEKTAKTFPIVPNDNESAMYYDKQQYDLAQAISTMSGVISGFSLLVYFISLFAGKLIGIELMSVVQVSYAALIVLEEVNPCFKALSALELVNGFNYFSTQKQYLVDPKTPYSIRGLKLQSLFFLNYNLTMLLLLLAYSTSLVCYALSKTVFKGKVEYAKKAVQISKRCACEIALNCLMFSGYIIGVSFGIQIVYGTQGTNEPLQVLSLIQILILFALFVLYFILLTKWRGSFGEFTESFEKQKNEGENKQSAIMSKIRSIFQWISRNWYRVLLVERLIVGSFLVFFINQELSLLFPIFIFASCLGLTIYLRPYLVNRHNFRFGTNLIIKIVILVIYLSYSAEERIEKSTQQFVLPVTVCILLMICVVYSIAFLGYQLLETWRKRHKVQNDFEEFKQAQQQDTIIEGGQSKNIGINSLVTENELCLSENKEKRADKQKRTIEQNPHKRIKKVKLDKI